MKTVGNSVTGLRGAETALSISAVNLLLCRKATCNNLPVDWITMGVSPKVNVSSTL